MAQTQVTLADIIASDLPRGTALLADLVPNICAVRNSIRNLKKRIGDEKMKTEKGLSLLELKNQSLLSYLSNITMTLLIKLSGQKLGQDPCVERLVELRVLLERLRPIEDKLRYQMDKYIKMAVSGTSSKNDLLKQRGNLDNIASSDDEDHNEETADHGKSLTSSGQAVYKIPKISQTPYPEEESSVQEKERAKKRALNSAMLTDALYEHTEDPEVVYNKGTVKQKVMKKIQEIERYEEDNMLRLTLSNRERSSMRKTNTLGLMDSEILGSHSLDALDEGYDPSQSAKRKRKRRSSIKGKRKGSKGFKRRKKH